MRHILTIAMGFCFTLNISEISAKKFGRDQFLNLIPAESLGMTNSNVKSLKARGKVPTDIYQKRRTNLHICDTIF